MLSKVVWSKITATAGPTLSADWSVYFIINISNCVYKASLNGDAQVTEVKAGQ